MSSSPSRTHRGLLGGTGNEDKKSPKPGNLTRKSKSFYGRQSNSHPQQLRRPKTDTNLLSSVKFTGITSEISSTPTKLLLNVNIQRSLGAVKMVMSQESTVGDLVAAVVQRYAKEERRPFLMTTDPSCFDLHYSQFSLESLDRSERLMKLGSRNFFLCLNKCTVDAATTTTKRNSKVASSSSSSSCSNEVEKTSSPKINELPWLRFMHFML